MAKIKSLVTENTIEMLIDDLEAIDAPGFLVEEIASSLGDKEKNMERAYKIVDLYTTALKEATIQFFDQKVPK